MSRRVDELINNLMKYSHLIGGVIDIEWVRLIESIQTKIIDDIRGEAGSYDSLLSFINNLESTGKLYELIESIAREIGEEVPDPKIALTGALAGDLNIQGSKPAIIALQAIARAYAEIKLSSGPVIEPSAICPICGAKSETMYKRGNNYYMVCHFCSYTWLQSENKPTCPYCGNQSEITLGIVSDKTMRIALIKCWECGSTWRIILDESIKAPLILLPLIAMAAEKFRNVIREIEKESGYSHYSLE
ncbi:MAG: formate dehydrogenase accessory protein FdhE [Acidilobaceae archaeon]